MTHHKEKTVNTDITLGEATFEKMSVFYYFQNQVQEAKA
jgi:hypothetical protein